jgi:hypothetical protein
MAQVSGGRQSARGALRMARAVGANLRCGLLDAALSLAGRRPRGQAPIGPADGLSLSLTTGISRRVTGVRTVASGALDRSVPQAELIQRLSEYHAAASVGNAERDRIVAGLWKSEGLAGTIGKHLLPENSLSDPALPRQARPVLHVGFGSGSTEGRLFDAAKLDALFGARCAKDHLGFAYEGVGAILRVYEPGFFKLMAGAGGLIRLDAPEGPDPAGFFADYLTQYPSDIQRLIAHGYGRLIAFSHMNIYSAIREATTLPAERIEPAVHGAAFAFAMMNSVDFPRTLRQSAVPFDPAVRAAFQNGLIYALVFLDWYVPGVLANWQPEARLEADLIDHASREAALSVQRGFPLAFRLANPRG